MYSTVPVRAVLEVISFMRTLVTLACTECKRRNYTTTKNKATMPEPHGDQEVLPLVPPSYGPQGDPLVF